MLRLTRFAVYTVRKILHLAVSDIVGGALVGIGAYIHPLENRPDLRLWHLAELESEYGAALDQAMESFEDYLEPFFSYMTERIAEFLDLGPGTVRSNASESGHSQSKEMISADSGA